MDSILQSIDQLRQTYYYYLRYNDVGGNEDLAHTKKEEARLLIKEIAQQLEEE